MNSTSTFRAARDLLITHRTNYPLAHAQFKWPRFDHFNWALDWFDAIARGNTRTALRIVSPGSEDQSRSFEALRHRSNQLANHFRSRGLKRGDRLLVMLGNQPILWEVILAAIKVGCPLIPTTTLMMAEDLKDRITRGAVRAVVTDAAYAARFDEVAGAALRFLAQGTLPGWASLDESASAPEEYTAESPTRASDPLLLYFTSGTTSRPKLVVHTQVSYPVGHLSTMYWVGLRPGDVHLNLSSPGWAKHAWSSLFAPWNAEATIVMLNSARFDATELLRELERCQVTTFCAPPTVWRSLIQLPLKDTKLRLRELVSAGEPLNPEVIASVREAWHLDIRDGYGQTETTLQIGNFPGQPVKPGTMGRPAPGYEVKLLGASGEPAEEGEICIAMQDAPVGVMSGYLDDPERTSSVMAGGHYHTGDVASVDADGLFTYVGRNDDVFKSSDYRISPFELESFLIEHEMVLEAAVVPSPDSRRLSVPKAFVVLTAGAVPSRELALSILSFVRTRISPFKRIRRLEFSDLPKTVSGKIRRAELRTAELERHKAQAGTPERRQHEYWEEDFPELRG